MACLWVLMTETPGTQSCVCVCVCVCVRLRAYVQVYLHMCVCVHFFQVFLISDCIGGLEIRPSLSGKSWLIGEDSDSGRDWGQEEKGMTEDEMAGWYHGLDGRESEWTPGVGDGQGGLVCCDSWGRKESHTTERLNWTKVGRVCS